MSFYYAKNNLYHITAKYRGGVDTTSPVQPQHTTLLSPLDYD